jgi:hypothetical protein
LRDKLLEMQPGSLSTGLVEYFSEGELQDGYLRYAAWLNRIAQDGQHYAQIYRECVIPSPCWMVYRSDLIRCGAFDPGRYPEDYDLCFRFYRSELTPVSVPQVLHYWRDHGARASRNDPHYADNRFFELKIDYFLELERSAGRPLVLWGAGAKGKLLARLLLERQESFHWVCDNPRKWGKHIYGVEMKSWEEIPSLDNPQLMLAVLSPVEQQAINRQLKKWQRKPKIHYFWFC